jgi:hypothetical protein
MPLKPRYYTRRRKGGSHAHTKRSSISRLSPSAVSKEAEEAAKKGKEVALNVDAAAKLAEREAAFARGAASKAMAIVRELESRSGSSDDDSDSDKDATSGQGRKFIRTLQYRSGDYVGEVKGHRYSSVRHGFGQLEMDDRTYQGEWKNDKEHGFGVLEVWPTPGFSGYRYEGEFKRGSMTGYGVCVFSGGGDVYKGHHLDDEFDGYGLYLHITTTGGVTKCEYKGGVKEGYGMYESDTMSHIGVYSKDRFLSGKGTITLVSGTYTGDLKTSRLAHGTLKHGNGKLVYANGDVYEGQFKNDKRYGQGKLTAQNGSVQEGIWSNDKLTGEVTAPSPAPGVPGPTLHGEFINGAPVAPLDEAVLSGDDTSPDI